MIGVISVNGLLIQRVKIVGDLMIQIVGVARHLTKEGVGHSDQIDSVGRVSVDIRS